MDYTEGRRITLAGIGVSELTNGQGNVVLRYHEPDDIVLAYDFGHDSQVAVITKLREENEKLRHAMEAVQCVCNPVEEVDAPTDLKELREASGLSVDEVDRVMKVAADQSSGDHVWMYIHSIAEFEADSEELVTGRRKALDCLYGVTEDIIAAAYKVTT